MGLTERHWFENEDVPENYEWDLEDAVYNSCTNKKADTVEVIRCKNNKEAIVNDLNVAKLMLCNRQMLTPEMRVRIGQAITSALDLLKEQKAKIEQLNRFVNGFSRDAIPVVRCKDCKWYDERISLCDNCGLPREQTFFCADGKGR